LAALPAGFDVLIIVVTAYALTGYRNLGAMEFNQPPATPLANVRDRLFFSLGYNQAASDKALGISVIKSLCCLKAC